MQGSEVKDLQVSGAVQYHGLASSLKSMHQFCKVFLWLLEVV